MADWKFDNFDGYVRQYRKNHTDNIKRISGADSNYFSEYKVKEIMNCEKNTRNAVVLDFGCGDGNSAPYFIEHLLSISYYGIDISSKSIEVAKRQRFKQCHFETFNGENIPFKDNTFDIVFMANVLHHINCTYHKIILSECYRVLKKSGRLYIFEHNYLNPLTRKIVNDCEFDVGAKLIPSNNIKGTVKEIGFNDIKRKYTIFFPRKFLFKFVVPFEKYLHWCPFGGQYYVMCYK